MEKDSQSQEFGSAPPPAPSHNYPAGGNHDGNDTAAAGAFGASGPPAERDEDSYRSGVADLAAAIQAQAGRGGVDNGGLAVPPAPSDGMGAPPGPADAGKPVPRGGVGKAAAAAVGANDTLPPHMYVDHTYYDYAVVGEDELRLLDENPALLPAAPGPAVADARERLAGMSCTYGPMKKNAGGVVVPFPGKLLELLDRPDVEDVVRWMPHGEFGQGSLLNPAKISDADSSFDTKKAGLSS